jgi:hypothetical protein
MRNSENAHDGSLGDSMMTIAGIIWHETGSKQRDPSAEDPDE